MKKQQDKFYQDMNSSDKKAVEMVVRDLGYKNLEHFVTFNEATNTNSFLKDFNFTSIRDFFLGYGFYERIVPFALPDSRYRSVLK